MAEENKKNDAMPKNAEQQKTKIPQQENSNQNWDKKAVAINHRNNNLINQTKQDLNPDREKRQNNNLNPDRNSGDR